MLQPPIFMTDAELRRWCTSIGHLEEELDVVIASIRDGTYALYQRRPVDHVTAPAGFPVSCTN
jgi:hypothetical protein